ncbi:calmodulin-binding transcription activator 1-like [Hydractinia symbiolongicarpus]|uniref:calmodulin-binding transcription activator 1-like n=1 Tax=Hydractinia symbiolongicarpus TaxID=13093 RepID=UPI00254F6439|nr:calmodulin-binding transcription activator 1-like [Hydractinia symbiolongicarpus]
MSFGIEMNGGDVQDVPKNKSNPSLDFNAENVNGINIDNTANFMHWNVNPNSLICTSTTDGVMLYPPISKQDIDNDINLNSVAFERHLLHQIIANDVQQPSKLTSQNYDPRDTVVKNAPDGAVQITYRKMVNTAPTKNSQLAYILPKPASTGSYQTTFSITQTTSNIAAAPFAVSTHNVCRHVTSTVNSSAVSYVSAFDPLKQFQSMPSNSDKISCNVSNPSFGRNLTINLPKMQGSPTLVNSVPTLVNSVKAANIVPVCSDENQNVAFQQFPQATTVNPTLDISAVDGELLNNCSNFEKLGNFDLDIGCLSADNFDDLNFKHLYHDITALNQNAIISSSLLTTNSSVSNMQSIFTVPSNQEKNSSCTSSENIENTFISLSPQNRTSTVASPINIETKQTLIDIIDVSPEISTISGANKIILIGSWNAKDARYQCRFGDVLVDAELIQNGVLRCFSPAHKAGKIKLLVLCNDTIVSNTVDFEFVDPVTDEKSINHDSWLSIKNESLVELLKQRITAIVEMFGLECKCDFKEINSNDIEEEFVAICKRLVHLTIDFSFDYNVEDTMTVLHLAAALGYVKLIQLLLSWVESNPNQLISVEACPTRYDQFKLLPLMWSSAKGHFNTTCVLHQWEEDAIHECDNCGCTAIDLARECGHDSLVAYLERLLRKSSMSRENSVGGDISGTSPQNFQPTSFSQGWCNDISEGSSSRTLGKTLAYIQSIISNQDDESDSMCSDGEESLFETSPFTPRQRSFTEENRPATSTVTLHSPPSPGQSSFNRGTRETAEFCEFFFKAKKIEKDFAELTLTDAEQEELYRAANVIQNAFKSYKERRNQRNSEFSAAVLIQSYYRRYKQYAAFKKMQKGAVLIQNQYRAHREKAKKKCQAASVIQNYYRQYRERKHSFDRRESYQQKNRQQQADERKLKRFLQHTTNRLSRKTSNDFLTNTEFDIMECES